MNKLSIVIVSFNTKQLTLNCLRSIFDTSPNFKLEVIVVDNNSSDGSVESIRQQFKYVQLIENKVNLGFATANNQGINAVKSQYYLLLNSDTSIVEDSLEKLINFADQSKFGIISPKIINPDGSFQPNGGNLPNIWAVILWLSNLDLLFPKSSYQVKEYNYFQSGLVGWVGGTAMLISDRAISKVGLLDENIFMYAEDVEYCLRARNSGFKIGWFDGAKVTHMGGASSSNPRFRQWLGEFRGLIYIYNKHYGFLAGFGLKILSWIFILIRAVVFTLIGRLDYGRTYVKVAASL